MDKCRYCNDTGKITLLTSIVDCNCVTRPESTSKSNLKSFPEGSNLMYAWYSKEIAQLHGTVVYLDAITEQEVTITEISRHPTCMGQWKDIKFVGIIDKKKRVRGGINIPKCSKIMAQIPYHLVLCYKFRS